MESLGYQGISIIFKEEHVLKIGTSLGEKATSMEFIEYVHAVIKAGSCQ